MEGEIDLLLNELNLKQYKNIIYSDMYILLASHKFLQSAEFGNTNISLAMEVHAMQQNRINDLINAYREPFEIYKTIINMFGAVTINERDVMTKPATWEGMRKYSLGVAILLREYYWAITNLINEERLSYLWVISSAYVAAVEMRNNDNKIIDDLYNIRKHLKFPRI